MPNFSSLARLEVTEKFVGGWVVLEWDGFQVTTVSNLIACCFNVALS